MKTRLATALSVVGVLTAGSAAALVNTQILDEGPAESTANAAALQATPVDLSIPEVEQADEDAAAETVPSTTSSTGVGTTATRAAVSTGPSDRGLVEGGVGPAAPAPTSYLTTYNVGQAGSVTVDVIDGRLLLVKSEPMSGWTVTDTDEDAAENSVEVEFSSSTVRVEFEASFVDGQIVPKVSSKAIGATSSGDQPPSADPPASGTSGTLDDDEGEDDSYEDDGHEDGAEDDNYDEPEDHPEDHPEDDSYDEPDDSAEDHALEDEHESEPDDD